MPLACSVGIVVAKLLTTQHPERFVIVELEYAATGARKRSRRPRGRGGGARDRACMSTARPSRPRRPHRRAAADRRDHPRAACATSVLQATSGRACRAHALASRLRGQRRRDRRGARADTRGRRRRGPAAPGAGDAGRVAGARGRCRGRGNASDRASARTAPPAGVLEPSAGTLRADPAAPNIGGISTRITTRSWASSAVPPTRRSRRPTASSRAATTRTSPRRRKPRSASRRSRSLRDAAAIRRKSARPTTAWAACPGRISRPPPDWFDRFGSGRSEDLHGVDLGEIFESMGLSGCGGSAACAGHSGRGLRSAGALTFEEAFHGTERTVQADNRSSPRAFRAARPMASACGCEARAASGYERRAAATRTSRSRCARAAPAVSR